MTGPNAQEAAMHNWDAEQYMRFRDERTLPGIDLLTRVALDAPSRIVDLGCGPGNSTRLLRERWPDARITGLDSSPAMLAAAGSADPGIDFVLGDIALWQPDAPVDLIYSNAALQWVGDHARLLPRLLACVAPGGALAVQMPRNHDFETHALMRDVAAEPPWRERLAGARPPSPVEPPEFYYDLLAPHCGGLRIWETNYIQAMDDVAAIVEWLRGTGLAPFLARLGDDEKQQFLARYRARLAQAFPPRRDGRVLLPYPRLFLVADRAP
jgi:trans-aconitate 2-methyltransferase